MQLTIVIPQYKKMFSGRVSILLKATRYNSKEDLKFRDIIFKNLGLIYLVDYLWDFRR